MKCQISYQRRWVALPPCIMILIEKGGEFDFRHSLAEHLFEKVLGWKHKEDADPPMIGEKK